MNAQDSLVQIEIYLHTKDMNKETKIELEIIWHESDYIARDTMDISPYQVEGVEKSDFPYDDYDYQIKLEPEQYAKLASIKAPLNFKLSDEETSTAYFYNTY